MFPHSLLVLLSFAIVGSLAHSYGILTVNQNLFRKLFLGPKADVLSTEPFCFMYHDNQTNGNTQTITEQNMTFLDYKQIADKQLPLGDLLLFTVEILHLVQLDERQQTVTLVLSSKTLWNDCRFSWPVSAHAVESLRVSADTFSKLNVYLPGVRIAESLETKQLNEPGKAINLRPNGVLESEKEFATTLLCKLDFAMFPFDSHTCNVTFESQEPFKEIKHALGSVRHSATLSAKELLGRYIASGSWTLAMLPSQSGVRKGCSRSELCTYPFVRFQLLFIRHPDGYLVNLCLPAFLIVLLSAFVFLVPLGGAGKLAPCFCNWIALFVFLRLIYDKVPGNSSSATTLLGQYLLICILLVTASCVYAAVSSVFATNKHRAPHCLHKSVRLLGPLLLLDSHRLKRVGKSKRRRKLPQRNIAAIEADGSVASCSKNNRGDPNASQADEVTWATFGALIDRLFFLVLLFTIVLTSAVLLARGYAHWRKYGGHDKDKLEMAYICEQSKLQGDPDAHACEVYKMK